MAGRKTNSNSITAILVNKLNYKKSGFRTAILKEWGLPDNVVFYDGTHSSINISGINGKRPDIIGKRGGKTLILIEVKVNLKEDLQPSQKEGGEYENAVNKNKELNLIYIVPDDYTHSEGLPKNSKKIQIVSWSKIYEIAKENDNTGFTELIDYFVESQFHTNDLLLSKGDVAMFLSPSIIGLVNSLYLRIKKMMKEFVSANNSIIQAHGVTDEDEFGEYYYFVSKENKININENDKKDVWIGLCEIKDSKYSFFMAPWGISTLEKYKEDDDYFIINQKNGPQVYIPVTPQTNKTLEFLYSEDASDQQKKFNELMNYNIKKLLKMLSK